MKGFLFAVTLVSLAVMMPAMSCGNKATPAAPSQNITGVLSNVNTPGQPGPDVVTIQTPQGPQTFSISSNATFTLDNQACSLDDIGKVVETGNTTYQCTAYYDDRLNAVTSLKVWQQVGPLKNP